MSWYTTSFPAVNPSSCKIKHEALPAFLYSEDTDLTGAECSPAALWGGFCSPRGRVTLQLSLLPQVQETIEQPFFPPSSKEVTVSSNSLLSSLFSSSLLSSTQNPFMTLLGPYSSSEGNRKSWTSAGLFPSYADTVHLERAMGGSAPKLPSLQILVKSPRLSLLCFQSIGPTLGFLCPFSGSINWLKLKEHP